MTDSATNPAAGTSTPTGAASVAEAQAMAQAAAAAPAPDAGAAAAPVAPAPAPQAPADKSVDLPVDKDDKGANAYQPTGNKNLDASLDFLGKKGFGPDHPAMQEAMNGNFALLRAQIAEKGIAGGEAYVMIAEKVHEEMVKAQEEKRTADRAALYAIAGGEEQWKQVAEWGKTNASAEQTNALKEMLVMGGEHMKIAAGWLANAYTKATGGVPETDGAGPNVADTRGAAVVTQDALSPQEYGRATEEARRTHKGREPFEASDAYRKLVERRGRYKG